MKFDDPGTFKPTKKGMKQFRELIAGMMKDPEINDVTKEFIYWCGENKYYPTTDAHSIFIEVCLNELERDGLIEKVAVKDGEGRPPI